MNYSRYFPAMVANACSLVYGSIHLNYIFKLFINTNFAFCFMK